MDKLKILFKQLSKKEKQAVLFDRISNFNFEDIYNRLLSYPKHILDSFLMQYDAGYFSEFIHIIKNMDRIPKEHIESTTFKVFTYFNDNIDFEERTGQNQMIKDIDFAIKNKNIFIGEAPPGTGKSYAYLNPIIKKIIEGKRIVISTNTKNLQKQIFNHDLNIAANKLKIQFSVSIIKGISNYLCFNKYEENKNNIDPLAKLAIEGFIYLYSSGDLSDFKYNYNIDFNNFVSDNEYCLGNRCPFYNKCYFMKIKEHTKTSDIILTNHYFSLIDKSMNNKFFGNYDIIVFDESHNMENVITELFSYKFNFNYVFKMLYYFLKKISIIEKNMEANFIFKNILPFISNERNLLEQLIDKIEVFNLSLKEQLIAKEGKKYNYGFEIFEKEEHIIFEIKKIFENIIQKTEEISNTLNNDYKKENDFIHTHKYFYEKILQFEEHFGVITIPDNNEYAFFYELEKNSNIIFNAVPIETGNIFSKLLINDDNIIPVFISATLGINGDFSLFKKQIGIDTTKRRFVEETYNTSFDWEKQMQIIIVNNMGNPNSIDFLNKTAELIRIISNENKNTLILTTSYDQINYLKNELSEKKYIFQTKKGNPEILLEKFKKKRGNILIGTSRFWEGVDLPGKFVEIIVILKMPFTVPDDPIFIKRKEFMEMNGENAFMNYALPNAILKLKQGIGRLIRKKDDSGVVYILDERIIKKKYGSIVRKNLFVKPRIIDYRDM